MTTPSLPTGWTHERIGDVATISRGASPRPIASSRWFSDTSEVGWVRIADLGRSDGLTLRRTVQRLSPDGIARSRLLPPGTLIMSIAATVGLPIITAIPACIHDGFVAFQRLKRIDQTYLMYVVKSLEDELRGAGQTGSQSNVNASIVKGLRISLPPQPEQRRIADSLRDADYQIASLERLITKRQAVEQGMMQRLLTGRTRLPDFAEPWVERAIGDMASVNPESLGSETNTDEVIDYISLEDVSRGRLLSWSQVRYGDAPSRARRCVRNHDILFGTVRPNLQSHLRYTGDLLRPVASTGFAVVRATSGLADSRFLFYLLMSRLAVVQIDRIIAGSNYPAVSSEDVRELRFSVPDVCEQAAIGAAITHCGTDIQMLGVLLGKAKAVKQGMMQELLTGRTRLPVMEPAPA
jgi:type I restriction enzyme S subunit